MNTFLKNLANLIKVKTLITLAIIGSMCYGFLTGLITAEVFCAVAGSVITYYFTRTKDNAE